MQPARLRPADPAGSAAGELLPTGTVPDLRIVAHPPYSVSVGLTSARADNKTASVALASAIAL